MLLQTFVRNLVKCQHCCCRHQHILSGLVNRYYTTNQRRMRIPLVLGLQHKIHESKTHGSINIRTITEWGSTRTNAWSKAISDAEKIVGYPTSFMSLRCLLSDELSNVAVQMRRLVGTQHPLLKTARGFVYDNKHNMQTRGLIVLLMSKAAGPANNSNSKDTDLIGGISSKQRQLAEISEMIHTANLIHKGVVDLDSLMPQHGPVTDMEFGNKMAVLSGDFLLAGASMGLAELWDTQVVEIISSAISDLMRAEFVGKRDSQGNHLLTSDTTMSDWETQTYLASGSLLAKSCQAALRLAGHAEDTQQRAFDYGKHLAAAHQLQEDLQPFTHEQDNGDNICLASAPVILHYSKAKHKQQLRSLTSQGIDHRKVETAVRSDGAIKEAQTLCREHGNAALDAIRDFPQSEALTALQSMINAAIRSSLPG